MRYRGIAARVRCGFATYFQVGQGLDHWITEYRNRDGRWVRIDNAGHTVQGDNPAGLLVALRPFLDEVAPGR